MSIIACSAGSGPGGVGLRQQDEALDLFRERRRKIVRRGGVAEEGGAPLLVVADLRIIDGVVPPERQLDRVGLVLPQHRPREVEFFETVGDVLEIVIGAVRLAVARDELGRGLLRIAGPPELPQAGGEAVLHFQRQVASCVLATGELAQ
jgi:hypothetical protein